MIQYHDLIMDVMEFQQIIDAWFFRNSRPRFSDSKEDFTDYGGRKLSAAGDDE